MIPLEVVVRVLAFVDDVESLSAVLGTCKRLWGARHSILKWCWRDVRFDFEEYGATCPDYIFESFVEFMSDNRLGRALLISLERHSRWDRFDRLRLRFTCPHGVVLESIQRAMTTKNKGMLDCFLGMVAMNSIDERLRGAYDVRHKIRVFANPLMFTREMLHMFLSPPEHAVMDGCTDMVRVYLKHG